MRKSIRIALVGGAAAVLVAGGSTAAAFAATHDDGGDDSGTTSATSTKVTRAEAEATAKRAVPGARVTETELDDEADRRVWEVDLVKQRQEYEVTVDASTGKVISNHKDDDHDDHGRHHDGKDDDHHDDD